MYSGPEELLDFFAGSSSTSKCIFNSSPFFSFDQITLNSWVLIHEVFCGLFLKLWVFRVEFKRGDVSNSLGP